MNKKILLDKRFGKLVVISRTEQKYRHCYVWQCLCDCGNITYASTYALTHGKKTSCGCVKIKNDLSGKRFGRLVAICLNGKIGKNGALWDCICDCGSKITASRWALLSGQKQSCGCLHNELATKNINSGRNRCIIEGTNISTISSNIIFSNNSSGTKGVSWHKNLKKWQARIQFKGQCYNLGNYKKIEDAIKARKNAEEKYFKPFLNNLKR